MAKEIEFEQAHDLGLEGARERVAALEKKLSERFGVQLSWQGDVATVNGTGVSGTLALSPTNLKINLKLGLMVRPMASQIQAAMQRQVDKALGRIV